MNTTQNNISIMSTDFSMKNNVLCSHCGTSWIVCTMCNKQFTLSNHSRANQHFSIHHNCTTSSSSHPYIENEQHNELNLEHDEESSLSTLSVDSTQQHRMHSLYQNNIFTRDVSMAEMTIQHNFFLLQTLNRSVKDFNNLFQKLYWIILIVLQQMLKICITSMLLNFAPD